MYVYVSYIRIQDATAETLVLLTDYCNHGNNNNNIPNTLLRSLRFRIFLLPFVEGKSRRRNIKQLDELGAAKKSDGGGYFLTAKKWKCLNLIFAESKRNINWTRYRRYGWKTIGKKV